MGQGGTGVAGRPRPPAVVVAQVPHAACRRRLGVGRGVGGAVVDHHHLSAGGDERAQGAEQRVEVGGPVAHRHHHGDVGGREGPGAGHGDRVGGPGGDEAFEQPLAGRGGGHDAGAAGAGQLRHDLVAPGAEAEQAQG